MARSDWLFMTSNTSLWSLRIEKFEDYIRKTIEHHNNWKIGLQLLHDAYLEKYRSYDGMTGRNIAALLQEYSPKYVDFLQAVIGQGLTQHNRGLWAQELTFLYNILLQTGQTVFLLDQLLPKLCD